MKTFLLISSAISLLGCTTVEYVYPPIHIPHAPALPLIMQDQMECLPSDAFRDLAVREELIWGYVEQLRAIMRAHNEGVPK